MKIQTTLFLIVGCLLSAIAYAEQDSANIKLQTPSGYITNATLHSPAGKARDTGIVFIHGKRGGPGAPHNENFMAEMVALGYRVLSPEMPWAESRGYDGTRKQGQEVIAEAIKTFKTSRVVLVGHSMGGMAVIQYGSGEVLANVAGLALMAPGHDPNIAAGLRDDTYSSVRTACKMVADGKGKEIQTFQDVNGGKHYSIRATPEYYCSFFSTNEYPDAREVVKKIKIPVLFISGAKDRLTDIYSHRSLYRSIPENSKSKYMKLSGNHLSVLFSHTDKISGWIDNL
jgi:pimeloyl-ACP methyl ester carboxylesterase